MGICGPHRNAGELCEAYRPDPRFFLRAKIKMKKKYPVSLRLLPRVLLEVLRSSEHQTRKNTAKSITDVTYFVLNLEAVPREHCSRKHWATLQRQLQNTLEVHSRLAFLTHIQDQHFHSFIPMHFSLCHLSLMLFAPTFSLH